MTDPFGVPDAGAPGVAAPVVDPFGDPAAAGAFPGIGALVGRLVLIEPVSPGVETVADAFNPGQTKERMTANVHVLSGPNVFSWTDRNGQPKTLEADGAGNPFNIDPSAAKGAEFSRMWIEQRALIGASRDCLKPGNPQKMTLGVVRIGTSSDPKKRAPYVLEPVDANAKVLARSYLATRDPFG